jgi:hypothetical protein
MLQIEFGRIYDVRTVPPFVLDFNGVQYSSNESDIYIELLYLATPEEPKGAWVSY